MTLQLLETRTGRIHASHRPRRALCGAPLSAMTRAVTTKERSGQQACPLCADALVRAAIKEARDRAIELPTVRELRAAARDAGFFPTAIAAAVERAGGLRP